MKRSELNQIIKYTIEKVERKIPFPDFAYYSRKDWENLPENEQELIDNMLGWDITDFGTNDFQNVGLTIFTFRNGNFHNKEKYPKSYCEKLLYMLDGQMMPYHYHWYKTEDVINRGGGDLKITLYNSSSDDFANREKMLRGEEGTFTNEPVIISMDGKQIEVEAGGSVILKPGSSITISPGQYHTWQAIPGTGDVMLFEVSKVNDDNIDNRFKVPGGRFPQIEEDEDAEYLIFKDYNSL